MYNTNSGLIFLSIADYLCNYKTVLQIDLSFQVFIPLKTPLPTMNTSTEAKPSQSQ